ncbi:MAG: hypothetical protein D6741_06520 [Planctomycetota bacterium]|nr:MAG: hypothetical protein D6741_06520 [Planctomycetota bacterium]
MNRPPEPGNGRLLKTVLFCVVGVPFLLAVFGVGAAAIYFGARIVGTGEADVRAHRVQFDLTKRRQIHYRGKAAAAVGTATIAVGILFCVEAVLQGVSIVASELLPGADPERRKRIRKLARYVRMGVGVFCALCFFAALILQLMRV